jgi:hypothetical protein
VFLCYPTFRNCGAKFFIKLKQLTVQIGNLILADVQENSEAVN